MLPAAGGSMPVRHAQQGHVLPALPRWVQVGETASLPPEVAPLHARQSTGRQPATAQGQGLGTHPAHVSGPGEQVR